MSSNTNKYIIAVDGASSTGKTTIAKELAKKLGFLHIDTGAMYRAVTFFGMQHCIDAHNKIDLKCLVKNLKNIDITFKPYIDKNGEISNEIYLNNKNIEREIRSMAVSSYVSDVAQDKTIRDFLVDLQRKMAEDSSVVMDGRDIGTVVFPQAEYKFFITTNIENRALRRFEDIKKLNASISIEEVIENIKERDYKDSNRAVSPLKKAIDAIEIDNTHNSLTETIQHILSYIKDYLKT